MQKKLKISVLALICMTMLCNQSFAQNVQVYGRLLMTANQVETGDVNKVTEIKDNGSRLGFKGVEDLGLGMSALFGLEMGINADSGLTTTPAFRASYVGLRGNLGTLAIGRLDVGNPTGSPLYSQITSLMNFAPSDVGATSTTAFLNGRNRTSESIGFQSPEFGNLTFKARIYFRGAGTNSEPEDAAKGTDLGVEYKAGNLKAAIGYAKDTRTGGLKNNEFNEKWQVGLNYRLQKEWDVYLIKGVDTYKNTSTTRHDVDYKLLGTSYTMGQNKLVFNTVHRDVQSALTGVRKKNQLSYQYFLSKKTDLQAFIDNDSVDSSRTNVRIRSVGLGIRQIF